MPRAAAAVETGLGDPKLVWVDDTGSLKRRIRYLAEAVKLGVEDPESHRIVAEAVRGCPGNDQSCEVRTWFQWLKNRVRYEMQGPGDIFTTLRRTLDRGAADCDQAIVSLATGLVIMGYTAGARVVSVDGNYWNHIYTLVGVPRDAPSGLFPLELTIGPDGTPETAMPFWEIPPALRKEERDFLLQIA